MQGDEKGAVRETLFKGYYIQWSRKATLTSDLSAKVQGDVGEEVTGRRGEVSAKSLGQECDWHYKEQQQDHMAEQMQERLQANGTRDVGRGQILWGRVGYERTAMGAVERH